MLTYDLTQATGPLYEYIYQRIKQDILSGILPSGEKLPSKRAFAKNSGVSTITIQNAYDQLISEGYIYTLPKRGYYVSKLQQGHHVPKPSRISPDIQLPDRTPDYAIDLSGNQQNPELFPFSIWAHLSREIMASRKADLMSVSPTEGKLELRSAIAEHLHSFRGMMVDPNQIVIGAGTEYLYGLLIQLLGSDRSYAIENPGYKKLAQIYAQYGITCMYINMDDQGASPASLQASGATVAHICPTHHFPTGITMPASRRYELLAWACDTDDRYLIEDDYDSEFRTNGRPIPTLFSMDNADRVIYINTFSKSLSPTIRISYMVLPVHLINRFYSELSFYACTVSNFEQYILSEFIHRGYFEKHINRMRLYYSRQRKKAVALITESHLNSCSEIVENDSGLHFLLKLDTDLSDEELRRQLHIKGVQVHTLSEYYMTDSSRREHCCIINYSNLDPEAFRQGCDLLYECLKPHQNAAAGSSSGRSPKCRVQPQMEEYS